MEILLFDANSDAAQSWSRTANTHRLRLSILPTWPGIENIPDSPILVLDPSAVPDFMTTVISVVSRRPHQTVVVTGSDLAVSQVAKLMRAGVKFVFEKPLNLLLVEASMPHILETAHNLASERREYEKLKGLFDTLTQRERDVLDYVLNGIANKKTAEELGVSVRTIEARRAKVYSKTDSTSVVELVRKVDRLARLANEFEVPCEQPVTAAAYASRPISAPVSGAPVSPVATRSERADAFSHSQVRSPSFNQTNQLRHPSHGDSDVRNSRPQAALLMAEAVL